MDNTTTNSEAGKYFKLVPVSEKPEKEGRYIVFNGDGYFETTWNEQYGFHEEFTDCSNVTHYLRPYTPPAAPVREGMRWVKASERLPEKSNNYFVKVWSGRHKYIYHDCNHFDKGTWDTLSDPMDEIKEWLDESHWEVKVYNICDLQNSVREHIKQDNLFDWHEALTENEMTYLENLLLTFCPLFPPGSIGYEQQRKHIASSEQRVEGYTPVVALKDDDGHWYVIPTELQGDFRDMEERGHHDCYEAFNEKYSRYLTRGDLNNTQLYAKL